MFNTYTITFSYLFVNYPSNLYNKGMKLYVKEQIKTLLAQEGIFLKDLAAMVSEHTGKKCSPDSLSQKLRRGSLTYNETLMIAELLGYKIKFVKDTNLDKVE